MGADPGLGGRLLRQTPTHGAGHRRGRRPPDRRPGSRRHRRRGRAPGRADPGVSRPHPRRQRLGRHRAPDPAPAEPPSRRTAGQVAGGLRAVQRAHRGCDPVRGCLHPGAGPAGSGAARRRPIVDCGSELLRAVVPAGGRAAGSFFLIRRHQKDLPFTPLRELVLIGRCDTGVVFEHRIRVEDPEGGEPQVMRRIVLVLDQPTRDGETEIELVTNLPAAISAIVICATYRGRWRIEGHFQRLTELLHCEVPTLSYPRAALFAFAMAVVAGNALALLEGNLRAVHGEEEVTEFSHYAVVDEIAHTYRGMMIAVPPATWSFVRAYALLS